MPISGAPIELTFYDDACEPLKTYTKGFVPTGILEAALDLQGIDQKNLTREDVQKIYAIVIEFYGNQFSVDELKNQTELSECMGVIFAIIGRVEMLENPTLPVRPAAKRSRNRSQR